ncbi:MAG TPA: hypothetical protein VK914_09570 [bacterium]|jgi:hypothetical protein|nr:hypothetical protein [bacterium]
MKPDLLFSVLCDEVRREDNGKLMLIGLFEILGGLDFPLAYPGMAVVNRWCNGEGEFKQRVRMVDSKNRVLVETSENVLRLADMRATFTAVTLLRNVVFPEPGHYSVEILLDGDLKQRFALGVAQIRPPETQDGAQFWGHDA